MALTEPSTPQTGAALVEQWFDAELRPVLLQHLTEAGGQAAAAADTRHKTTIAAIEHWLTSFGQRSATWSPETREAVAVLSSELRGLLDSIGAF